MPKFGFKEDRHPLKKGQGWERDVWEEIEKGDLVEVRLRLENQFAVLVERFNRLAEKSPTNPKVAELWRRIFQVSELLKDRIMETGLQLLIELSLKRKNSEASFDYLNEGNPIELVEANLRKWFRDVDANMELLEDEIKTLEHAE